MKRPANPPVTMDIAIAILNTAAAFLNFLFSILAETNLETAIGNPYEDNTSIRLYTLNAAE